MAVRSLWRKGGPGTDYHRHEGSFPPCVLHGIRNARSQSFIATSAWKAFYIYTHPHSRRLPCSSRCPDGRLPSRLFDATCTATNDRSTSRIISCWIAESTILLSRSTIPATERAGPGAYGSFSVARSLVLTSCIPMVIVASPSKKPYHRFEMHLEPALPSTAWSRSSSQPALRTIRQPRLQARTRRRMCQYACQCVFPQPIPTEL